MRATADAVFSEPHAKITPYMQDLLASVEKSPPRAAPDLSAVVDGSAVTGSDVNTAGSDNGAAPGAESASFAAILAAADPALGERQVAICKACHSFDKGGPNMMGPNLWGVTGRTKPSAAGYKYSSAHRCAAAAARRMRSGSGSTLIPFVFP